MAGSLKTTCNVDEDLDACVTRAGEGEYVLLGKVERATVDEGVAQLINDHSTIRAPSHLTPSEGSLRPSDVDGFVLKDSAWPYPPVAVDGARSTTRDARVRVEYRERDELRLGAGYYWVVWSVRAAHFCRMHARHQKRRRITIDVWGRVVARAAEKGSIGPGGELQRRRLEERRHWRR